jgi:hypothetical protein
MPLLQHRHLLILFLPFIIIFPLVNSQLQLQQEPINAGDVIELNIKNLEIVLKSAQVFFLSFIFLKLNFRSFLLHSVRTGVLSVESWNPSLKRRQQNGIKRIRKGLFNRIDKIDNIQLWLTIYYYDVYTVVSFGLWLIVWHRLMLRTSTLWTNTQQWKCL